jgi:F420-non-reducing hydrogenase small subunit
MAKPKVALYWAASCGGCEIAVLAIHEKILDLAAAVDILFWPVAIDTKYKDVEALEDGEIDLCLFNGGIRTSENLEIAELLRRKSKLLVAFGSCSSEGGIPGLANLKSKDTIFDRAYHNNPSIDNPENIIPLESTMVPEGELKLPKFYDDLRILDHVVDVDYFIPGCPPVPEQIWSVVLAVLEGNLPDRKSVVGADGKTVCDQCRHEKHEKKIKAFHRPHEIEIDRDLCLLEQGVICIGPATRAGCGAQCTEADMPCRGCYGPPAGVKDQGAKIASAIASLVDSTDPEEIESIIGNVVDPAGTFYRFNVAASTLRRAKV